MLPVLQEFVSLRWVTATDGILQADVAALTASEESVAQTGTEHTLDLLRSDLRPDRLVIDVTETLRSGIAADESSGTVKYGIRILMDGTSG